VTQIVNQTRFEDGVNLALGGGGAKGFVHLGVVEGLAELEIPIKAIVGTSIGAIIGALFAQLSTSEYRREKNPQLAAARAVTAHFLTTDFWRYSDVSLFSAFTKGVLKGDKFSEWLADALQDEEALSPLRFDDLKFPLTITATDSHTGECLILNAQGDPAMFVHEAVRASMSIQWIFREVILEVREKPCLCGDGGTKPHRCWDGGTTGNCRFDIANRIYPGRPTIASSLTYRGDIVETHSSYLGMIFRPYMVLNHTTSIMMRTVEQALLEAMPEDERANTIFIAPRLSYGGRLVNTFDFALARRYREVLVENGKRAVRERLCPNAK
jgi:NTE family protein